VPVAPVTAISLSLMPQPTASSAHLRPACERPHLPFLPVITGWGKMTAGNGARP